MSDALSTYLHDHLAGAAYAIDLLEFMRDQHEGDDLGQFAADILVEIKQDRATLRDIAERVGYSGRTLKETASWLSEKISRIKLGHDAGDGLATFEALEFLEIGIHGKWALWRALSALATTDRRLAGFDFEAFAARAQQQHDRVEHRRVRLAPSALSPEQHADSNVSNTRYRQSLERCHHVNGGSSMRMQKSGVVGSVLLTLGIVVAVSMLPDLVRYLKIRAM